MRNHSIVLSEQAVLQALRSLCRLGVVRAVRCEAPENSESNYSGFKRVFQRQPVREPDGSLFVWPRVCWVHLLKRVVEEFCSRFSPSGVLVFLADGERKYASFKRAYLARLGVTIADTAKMPDVVVHDTERNWLLLIEAVTSAGPVDGKRRKELKELFQRSTAGLVFVTAFEDRAAFGRFHQQISWESEVWIASDADHIIHFDGERFLGPYPDVTPSALAEI